MNLKGEAKAPGYNQDTLPRSRLGDGMRSEWGGQETGRRMEGQMTESLRERNR